MIVCSKCNESKSEAEFYEFRGRNKGNKKKRSECKKCTLKIKRDRERRNNLEYDKWFKAIPKRCERCGENRSYMIDFHHINPLLKKCEISDIRSRSWSASRKIEVAKDEITKCIQLCSNCHREFHHLERTSGIVLDEYI